MPRLRHNNGGLKAPMLYMHKRLEGSSSLCHKTGVHTTKIDKAVTCQLCLAMLNKQAVKKPLDIPVNL